jgi:hypothetical protein
MMLTFLTCLPLSGENCAVDAETLTPFRLARKKLASSKTGASFPAVQTNCRLAGSNFDCGRLSPYFVTDPERMEAAFWNPYILIHEKKISSKNISLALTDNNPIFHAYES